VHLNRINNLLNKSN